MLLWTESRDYHKKPALRKVLDFVIVNGVLHSEFDEFKRENTHRNYSILPNNALLEYWNEFERGSSEPMIMMFGKPHHKLHYTEMDHLCAWVIQQREKLIVNTMMRLCNV